MKRAENTQNTGFDFCENAARTLQECLFNIFASQSAGLQKHQLCNVHRFMTQTESQTGHFTPALTPPNVNVCIQLSNLQNTLNKCSQY